MAVEIKGEQELSHLYTILTTLKYNTIDLSGAGHRAEQEDKPGEKVVGQRK